MKGKHLKFPTQESQGREVKQNKTKNPPPPKKALGAGTALLPTARLEQSLKGKKEKVQLLVLDFNPYQLMTVKVLITHVHNHW